MSKDAVVGRTSLLLLLSWILPGPLACMPRLQECVVSPLPAKAQDAVMSEKGGDCSLVWKKILPSFVIPIL